MSHNRFHRDSLGFYALCGVATADERRAEVVQSEAWGAGSLRILPRLVSGEAGVVLRAAKAAQPAGVRIKASVAILQRCGQ
jgi:hypothetical protein